MNITNHIKKCGKTRAEICAEAGISTAYLSMIEHGERRIGVAKLTALADALGVDPADIRPDLAAIFTRSAS
jgi:transcriptional regulator with XRE-family HTH domain